VPFFALTSTPARPLLRKSVPAFLVEEEMVVVV
jgi:hypothetical protein